MPEIQTELTQLLGIKRPIMLAGMNVAAGPDLAAAVTNAGGLGVIGGLGYTPDYMRKQIREIKEQLDDKDAPFGVDLLLPQVGGNARKTNYDYTGGKLKELIDVIIEEKTRLFVCAVGVPPKEVVDKLHAAKIPVMNMIGHPKHVKKALDVGVDIICAQGGEGGGHTGDIAFSVLIPSVVDICKGHTSPLWNKPVQVVAAGGINDGRGLAASLMYGAGAVWVGTRFVCAEEAGASPAHQKAIINSKHGDTVRSLIFTGRPLRVITTPFIDDWEQNKQAEQKKLLQSGKIPVGMDTEERPFLAGVVAGSITKVEPAGKIMQDMLDQASELLSSANKYVQAKL